MSDWLSIVPLLLVATSGLFIMLADAFSKEKAELALVTAVSLGTAGLVAVGLLASGSALPPLPEVLGSYLAVDELSLFFDFVICLGGALSALVAGGYLREHELERGELYVLIVLATFGAMVLARSTDLLTLFLGLETMSLSVYAMIAFRRTSARAVEGAMKYFLLGSFAAAILLFGGALLYAATGHTDFAGIGAKIGSGEVEPVLVLVGMLMVLAGLAFKVGAVPFHMWTPDAYEGAMTPVTGFMSVAVKAAAFAVFVRILVVALPGEEVASMTSGWPPVLIFLSVLSMVYGNVAAVAQKSVKRMLAYSSIAHAGYILLGLAAASVVGEPAISGVLFYLLAYTVSNILAFGSLVMIGSRGKEAVDYDDLAGVGRRHPYVALPFIIGVLSLMGFPPTAGFFGKYYVFNAAVQAGGGFVWLAVIGLLASAVGAYYYLRVVVVMLMKSPAEGQVVAVPMKSGYVASALAMSGAAVMVFGLLPSWALDLAISAAQKLIG
ncbi:MAG: NADH-quinone oxidoreductase subunit N [Myxococcales bacterium]|nr:NADH-quinone oxidoreductase subunit N [Myxococcales bacterium]